MFIYKVSTRVNAPQVANLDLADLLEERAQELAWEGWRWNDLIWFGQFEQRLGFKIDSAPNKRTYPILATEWSLI